MSFLENLNKLAQPFVKTVGNTKDPIETMRNKFANRADDTIKEIKAAAEKGRWFSKDKDGYVICMRNGNQAMTLNGHTHFSVKDAPAAVNFLNAAKKASIAGELDAAFQETVLKRKQKKTKAEQPAQ